MLPINFQAIVARLIGSGMASGAAKRAATLAEHVGERVYAAKNSGKYLADQMEIDNFKRLQQQLSDLPVPELQKFAMNDVGSLINISKSRLGK